MVDLGWHLISDEASYKSQRKALLIKLECKNGKINQTAYLDGAGIPTIGIGFNLRVLIADVGKVVFGKNWTSTLKTNLLAVVNKTYTSDAALQTELNKELAKSGITTGFTVSAAQAGTIFENIARKRYDPDVDGWVSGIPNSQERLAIFSLVYNGGTGLLGNSLRDAINQGNRPEAWFQIRYKRNKNHEEAVANRRYLEALYFGLYPTGETKKDDALSVGQMYAVRRTAILAYEDELSPAEAATNKRAAIVDIYHELHPAIERLKTEYGIAVPFGDTTNYEELLVATNTLLNLTGDGTAFDSTANDDDLLVGSAVSNKLVGGVGNDGLIGLGGADNLQGGSGDDWLDGGPGADTMNGGAGADVYVADDPGDRIIDENTIGGFDDVLLIKSQSLSLRFHDIEVVFAKGQPGVALKLTTGTGLGFVQLTSGTDRLTLNFDQDDRQADPVDGLVIDAAGGSDLVRFSSAVDLSVPLDGVSSHDPLYTINAFNFANALLDLSSFNITALVAGEQTFHAEPGMILVAPFSTMHFEMDLGNGDTGTFDISTSSNWSLMDVANSKHVLDVNGALTSSSFII